MTALSKVSPLIDQFHAAKTHRERADTLLRAPVSLLCKYHELFTRGALNAGFVIGAEHIVTLRTAQNATRTADGTFPVHLDRPLQAQLICLRRIAAGEPYQEAKR